MVATKVPGVQMKRKSLLTELGQVVVGDLGVGACSPIVVGIPGWRGHDSGLVGVCR